MSYYVVYHITVLLIIGTAVETPVPPDFDHQCVSLSSNNSAPCYNDTVDLICHYPYPEVFSDQQDNWEWNKERVFPDGSLFQRKVINQTTSRLRVRIDPANFFGEPVSFTCYRVRNNTTGYIVRATTLVDPQDVAKPPILAEPMVNGSSVRISWSHTDKGLCFRNLTFSYNITWYPVKGGETQSNTTRPGATEYIITNLMRNSGYRVGLVGFTLSEPPVYSETAVVNFTTKDAVSPGGGTDTDLVVVVVVVVVVLVVLLVVAVVVLIRRKKLPCCKRMVNWSCLRDRMKRKKGSSGQGDPESLDLGHRKLPPSGSASVDSLEEVELKPFNDIENCLTTENEAKHMDGVQPTSHQVYAMMEGKDSHVTNTICNPQQEEANIGMGGTPSSPPETDATSLAEFGTEDPSNLITEDTKRTKPSQRV